MNITQEGDQQMAYARRLYDPFLVECCTCRRWILNWAGSSYCCGSLCEVIAEGKEELLKLGVNPDIWDDPPKS